MEKPIEPSAHTVQPASPDTPRYDTPHSFPTPAHPLPSYNKGLTIAIIAAIMLIFFVLGTILLLGFMNRSEYEETNSTANSRRPTHRVRPSPTPDPYATQLYMNEPYGISLKYPVSWQIVYPSSSPDLLFKVIFSPTGSETLCFPDTPTSSCNLQQTLLTVLDNTNTLETTVSNVLPDTSLKKEAFSLNKYSSIRVLSTNRDYEVEHVFINTDNYILWLANTRTSDNTYAKTLFQKLLNSLSFYKNTPSLSGIPDPTTPISLAPSQVPYDGLTYKTISLAGFKALQAELSENDYQEKDTVMDGYMFTATKGDSYEFLATENKQKSFIATELYGYGSVVQMQTRLAWTAPQTGTYYYIVKGQDFYKDDEEDKFGRYTLTITSVK